MTHENYKIIRNVMNDCYNTFYAKWAKKALSEPLTDNDWITILAEIKTIDQKYKNTIAASLAKNLLIDLAEILENT